MTLRLLIWTLLLATTWAISPSANGQTVSGPNLYGAAVCENPHRPPIRQVGYQLTHRMQGARDSSCDEGCSKRSLHLTCGCPQCGPLRTWGRLEYVMGYTKGRNAPALASSGLNATNGILPAAEPLFGDKLGTGLGNGVRLDMGAWTAINSMAGMGLRFLYFGANMDELDVTSDGSTTLLAHPFFNPNLAANDARPIAGTLGGETAAGSISITSNTDIVSFEPYLRAELIRGQGFHLDLLGGYHFTRISDKISLQSQTSELTGGFINGIDTTRSLSDHFDASNHFHGASLGMMAEFRRKCWVLSIMGKISIGENSQRININGLTDFDVSPDALVGTYAGSTNSGHYEDSQVAYIPEVEFTFRKEIRENLSVSLGYSLMYWSDVLLAGDSMDATVNPNNFQAAGVQFPPLNPAFNFQPTDFWLQAVNVGIEWRY